MENRKDKALISDVKKVEHKKTPYILQWIDGVGSQNYSIEFMKKGY